MRKLQQAAAAGASGRGFHGHDRGSSVPVLRADICTAAVLFYCGAGHAVRKKIKGTRPRTYTGIMI